jgi:hypothetical protein
MCDRSAQYLLFEGLADGGQKVMFAGHAGSRHKIPRAGATLACSQLSRPRAGSDGVRSGSLLVLPL